MSNKAEALEALNYIMEQLRELHDEAAGIIEEEWPEEVQSLKAYQVLDFGWSSNPYDHTLESFINEKAGE